MSLVSVTLFDGLIQPTDPVNATAEDPILHDLGHIACGYVILRTQNESASPLQTPNDAPQPVPTIMLNTVYGRVTANDPKLNLSDQFRANHDLNYAGLPQVGPAYIYCSFIPARYVEVTLQHNSAYFTQPKSAKLTLHYFRDTGLLASN